MFTKKYEELAVGHTDKSASQPTAQQQTNVVKQAQDNNKPANNEIATPPTSSSKPVLEQPQYSYDPGTNTAYQQALAALQQAQSTLPTYNATYDDQLQDIYEKIVNREKFSYNMNEDALYQQYADQYQRMGQKAMMDTVGQAAAFTGGYGNTYGQMVGQQAYQDYLQQLNAVVPDLYGMALDQYNAEGDQMLNQYAMLGDMADDEYGKYQDALNQYWQNISFLKGKADDAYDRGYGEFMDSYNMQQDAYSKLVNLITTTGYTPNPDELQTAGMSDSQAKAYADYYKKQNTPTRRYTSDTPVTAFEVDNGDLDSNQIRYIQYSLGVEPTGEWDQVTKKAAGDLSADEAYALWNQGKLGKSVVKDQYATNGQNHAGLYFTGKSYSEAAAFLKSNGYSASGLMTQSEWIKHKNNASSAGGEHEANSYQEYLAAYIYGLTKK